MPGPLPVRKPDDSIVASRHVLGRFADRNRAARILPVRGIVVLWESLSLGFRALSWSAEMAAGEEEEPLSKTQIGWTMALPLPCSSVSSSSSRRSPRCAFGRIGDLVQRHRRGDPPRPLHRLHLGDRRSAEIGRVFEYHGAEHMSIHAFEAGEPPECRIGAALSPEHPWCGTSFLLIVVLGSIILFSFFGRPGMGSPHHITPARHPDHRRSRLRAVEVVRHP